VPSTIGVIAVICINLLLTLKIAFGAEALRCRGSQREASSLLGPQLPLKTDLKKRLFDAEAQRGRGTQREMQKNE
jgi:hypothetical protein